ncbi:uncharacterized protein LOC119554775 isoform X1 [Drosophila subpulchrella]|uniref:uncharacterized protein LOC119554775 isoform X1 n=1 Tax=Drosophila subpulchrella TaxID=1486046 RepID=UPI0018A15614|nr:uncharacterized protein LOC119554775 isoform X1 [Drosophila subpulchrella]XP_037721747.1 uncharacterized protein LOC119554775 isoform X1 [Drosophila subpulchrella]
MEPAKVIGKLKEQVHMEHNSRRSFPKVWAQIADKQTNKFYHQNEIDSQLSEQLKLKDLCSYLHNNQGECRFVSPEMYKNLLAVCRCGRARQGHHVGKCLQRALSPDYDRSKIQSNQPLRVPCTSNSSIGFVGISKSYQKLERSMQYVSPAYSMGGPRVTAVPYHNIIIG